MSANRGEPMHIQASLRNQGKSYETEQTVANPRDADTSKHIEENRSK